MAIKLTPEQINDLLMSKSVMDEPRSGFQKLADFLFGRTLPEQMTNAFTSLNPLRVGVMPGREQLASRLTRQGLRGPWFHGTDFTRDILEGGYSKPPVGYIGPARPRNPSLVGFDPNKIGQQSGLRLGEPAGVSLTRSPEVASKFGDVLRVGVDVPPSSVGEFVDPEFQRLLRSAYTESLQAPAPPSWRTGGDPKPLDYFLQGATGGARGDVIAEFNRAMSSNLRNQGVEAIRFNPRRFGEFELRVLDPQRAVPLGRIPNIQTTAGSDFPPSVLRYLGGRQPTTDAELARYLSGHGQFGLRDMLERQRQQAPEFPVRLRDILPGLSLE